jgi:hypothetical protein
VADVLLLDGAGIGVWGVQFGGVVGALAPIVVGGRDRDWLCGLFGLRENAAIAALGIDGGTVFDFGECDDRLDAQIAGGDCG